MESLQLKNTKVPVEIRQSRRARRMNLRLDAEKQKLVVTLPGRLKLYHVERFLKEQTDWVEKHWAKMQEQAAKRPQFSYQEGDTFYYLGEKVVLKVTPSGFKRPRAKVREQEMQVSLHRESTLNEGRARVKKAIETFYKEKASEIIHDRLQHFNQHYGFHYNQVTFRNQKTRWGSCSSQKNLNFNWRLAMAPIEVIDYVVVHELCHLKEMNHSPRFWARVEEAAPHHTKAKKWLRKNHFLLTF